MTPLEESVLVDHVEKQKFLRYTEINAVISSITEALSGVKDMKKTNDLLTKYREMLFPGTAVDKRRSAQRTKELLQKEFERGPMKIQALDYGGKKRKKRK